jgi:hypothetical protein
VLVLEVADPLPKRKMNLIPLLGQTPNLKVSLGRLSEIHQEQSKTIRLPHLEDFLAHKGQQTQRLLLLPSNNLRDSEA